MATRSIFLPIRVYWFIGESVLLVWNEAFSLHLTIIVLQILLKYHLILFMLLLIGSYAFLKCIVRELLILFAKAISTVLVVVLIITYAAWLMRLIQNEHCQRFLFLLIQRFWVWILVPWIMRAHKLIHNVCGSNLVYNKLAIVIWMILSLQGLIVTLYLEFIIISLPVHLLIRELLLLLGLVIFLDLLSR